MGLVRTDDNTVVDSETGATYYIPVSGSPRPGFNETAQATAEVNSEAGVIGNAPISPFPVVPQDTGPAASVQPTPQPSPVSRDLGSPAQPRPGLGNFQPVGGLLPDLSGVPAPSAAPPAAAPEQPQPSPGPGGPGFGPGSTLDQNYARMADSAKAVLAAQARANDAQLGMDPETGEFFGAEAERAKLLQDKTKEEANLALAHNAAVYNSELTAQAKAKARHQEVMSAVKKASDSKVDPSHWWNSRALWQKVAAVVSVAAGGLGGANGKNVGLDLISQYIEQDIGAQKENIGNAFRSVEAKRLAGAEGNQLDLQGIERLGTDYLLKLGSIDKEVQNRMAGIDAGSGLYARYLQFRADLAAKALEVENTIGANQIADARTQTDYAFRASEAEKARRFEASQRGADRALAREKAAGTGGGSLWDPDTALPTDRFTITDKDGNDITAKLGTNGVGFTSKEARQKVVDAVNQGQILHDAYSAFLGELDKNGFWDKTLSNQERLAMKESAISQAVRAFDKGAPSDEDKNRYERELQGYFGNDWKGDVIPGSAKKIVEQRIANNIERVNYALNTWKDPRLTGVAVNWAPQAYKPLTQPGEVSPDVRQAADAGAAKEAGFNVDPKKVVAPKTPAQIEADKRVARYSTPAAKQTFDSVVSAARKGDLETLRGYKDSFKDVKYTPTGKPGDRINVARMAAISAEYLEAKAALDRSSKEGPGRAISQEDIDKGVEPENLNTVLYRGKQVPWTTVQRKVADLREILKADWPKDQPFPE